MSAALAAILKEAGFEESDVPALKRIVGSDQNDELVSRLEKLRTLAFSEYLQWATARRRFGSLSELDSARVLSLFLNVRRSALSVASLVEDLGIPQARATSMIGRMKYGEARALSELSFAAAASDVEARLADAPEQAHHKAITASRDVIDRLQEVEFPILLSPPSELGKDGKYESAEALTVISAGRYGSTVSTSTKTWGYILAELKARGGV